jgi:hypothetical protein
MTRARTVNLQFRKIALPIGANWQADVGGGDLSLD